MKNNMLRDEIELYERLTGKDANSVSVVVMGAFLDGYETGKKENEPKLFSIEDLEEMKEIMYDSGGNMKGYGVLMKDIRYVVKTREIRQ